MRVLRCAVLFAVIAILMAVPTNSCYFRTFPVFVFAKRPDAPIAAYTAGRLGIILPTFAHSHLVVAWRYLTGKPLAENEQKEMNAYYRSRLGEPALPENEQEVDPAEAWVALRNTIIKSDDQPGDRYPMSYQNIVNCTASSFRTATATLKSRIAEFGAAHPGVRSWVEAQNAVFSNCDQTGNTPAPADPSLPAKFKFDRQYQIASAAFYRTDYDQAHDLFLAIGREPSSPWRHVARLVAARSLIRKGMLAKAETFDADILSAADKELRAIIADDDMRELRRAAEDLDDYVRLHTEPAEQRTRLARELASGQLREHNLTDYVWSFDDDAAPGDEMTDWIQTFAGDEDKPDPDTFANAMQQWEAQHSMPWLVAAITNATPKDRNVADLVAAAAKVEPSSPAFATVAYHRARLLLAGGDTAAAKREIDRVLALPDSALPPSARNQFRALRMPLANSIAEFTRDAVRLPPGDDMNDTAADYPPLFDEDAAVVFNRVLPLSSLIAASRLPDLPRSIRAELVAAAFTRAIVLGRPAVAQSLLPDMHRQFDKDLKAELDRFAAAPPSRRRIEALDLLVHTGGLSPFVTPFQGRVNISFAPITELVHGIEHENWWCVGGNGSAELLRVPKFAEPLRAEGEAEQKELQISGSSFMLRGTAVWANEYPKDPRVPEALSLAIHGAQWACPDAATRKYAQAAFNLLHERYGQTKWAKSTKYWYEGRD